MTGEPRPDGSTRIAALLFLAVIIVRPHLHSGAFPFVDGLLLIALLIAAAVALLDDRGSWDRLPGCRSNLYCGAALLGWLCLSGFWSVDRGAGIRTLLALGAGAASFLLAGRFAGGEKILERRLSIVVPAVVWPVAIHAIYQKVWGIEKMRRVLGEMNNAHLPTEDILAYLDTGRIAAGFGNPNMLAGLLAVMLPLTVGIALGARGPWRIPAWMQVAVTAAVLFMTGSLSGLLAAAGGVSLYALTVPGRTGRIRKAALAAVLAGSGALMVVWVRGPSFLTGPESSLVQRWEYFRAGLALALERPVLGWGAGGTVETLMRFTEPGIRPVTDPHNALLTVWSWSGVVGLILLLGFWSLWFARVRPSLADGSRRAVRALFAAAVAFWLHSLVDMDLVVPQVAFFGLTVMGGAFGGVCTVPSPARRHQGEAGKRRGAVVAALLLILCLPVFAVTYGEILLKSGERAMDAGQNEMALTRFRQAGRILPFSGRVPLLEARTLKSMGRVAEAAPAVARAGRLLPASPYPPWEAGRSALEQRRPQEALRHLATARERFPASPWILLDLARAHLMLGQRAAAVEALQVTIQVGRFAPQAVAEARKALKILSAAPGTDAPR